eukprot:6341665-Lingulodinium_polyedra.AAC.1
MPPLRGQVVCGGDANVDLEAPRDDHEGRVAESLLRLLARWGAVPIHSRAVTRRDRHGARRLDFLAMPASRPDDWRVEH